MSGAAQMDGIEVSLFKQTNPQNTHFHARGTAEECAAKPAACREGFMETNAAADPAARNESLRLINRALALLSMIEHSIEPALAVINERTGTAALVTRPQR